MTFEFFALVHEQLMMLASSWYCLRQCTYVSRQQATTSHFHENQDAFGSPKSNPTLLSDQIRISFISSIYCHFHIAISYKASDANRESDDVNPLVLQSRKSMIGFQEKMGRQSPCHSYRLESICGQGLKVLTQPREMKIMSCLLFLSYTELCNTPINSYNHSIAASSYNFLFRTSLVIDKIPANIG